MFEVHYSEVALADLDDIWGYITFELMNPDAAVNTVNGIIDAIDKLSEYPLSGTPLNALLDIESGTRGRFFCPTSKPKFGTEGLCESIMTSTDLP